MKEKATRKKKNADIFIKIKLIKQKHKAMKATNDLSLVRKHLQILILKM